MSSTFADLGVPHDLAERLRADGITAPFPVQELTLADALAGRDLCGRAPTGSGKTLAFAIPLVIRTDRAAPGRPRALVLVPTRELAAQVRETLLPLAQLRRRRVATVYGGTSLRRDQDQLRRGIDILVATPGRLADLVQRRNCDLREVGLVVIDEADRMADMGFLPEVKRLLDRTASDRQTLLYSATLDGDVDELVRRYQHDPVRHEVAEDPDARLDVRHVFWPAERDQRRKLTGDIVRRVGSAIVFTRTKHGADRLARQLTTDGVSTAAIHGNRSQGQRERALARFRSGEVTALVATDVAARGIHVDDVGVVVHYDLAGSDKDYVHRSGRTGRAGATGLVVTLVDSTQSHDTTSIQRSLQLPLGLHALDLDLLTAAELPAPVASLASRGGHRHSGGGGRTNGGRNAAARGGGGRARASQKSSSQGGRSKHRGAADHGESTGDTASRSSQGAGANGDRGEPTGGGPNGANRSRARAGSGGGRSRRGNNRTVRR